MGVRYALAIAAVFLAVSVVGSHAASYESEPTLGVNVKDEIKTLFNEWMQKFEKTYETIEETEFRLKTWATNHLRILKHNLSGDKSFTMAVRRKRWSTGPSTLPGLFPHPPSPPDCNERSSLSKGKGFRTHTNTHTRTHEEAIFDIPRPSNATLSLSATIVMKGGH